jgi:hypothetical protein
VADIERLHVATYIEALGQAHPQCKHTPLSTRRAPQRAIAGSDMTVIEPSSHTLREL